MLTLVVCELSVTWDSGMVGRSLGCGLTPVEARRAAIVSFLADAVGIGRPSPAPFKHRGFNENPPESAGGSTSEGIAVSGVRGRLLAERLMRVAADSPVVAAAVLAAAPKDPGLGTPEWHDLVDAVAKSAAASPVFASNLFNDGARRGAWSPHRRWDGSEWVLHRGVWLRGAASASGTGSQRLVAALCASLGAGVDGPGASLGGSG